MLKLKPNKSLASIVKRGVQAACEVNGLVWMDMRDALDLCALHDLVQRKEDGTVNGINVTNGWEMETFFSAPPAIRFPTVRHLDVIQNLVLPPLHEVVQRARVQCIPHLNSDKPIDLASGLHKPFNDACQGLIGFQCQQLQEGVLSREDMNLEGHISESCR